MKTSESGPSLRAYSSKMHAFGGGGPCGVVWTASGQGADSHHEREVDRMPLPATSRLFAGDIAGDMPAPQKGACGRSISWRSTRVRWSDGPASPTNVARLGELAFKHGQHGAGAFDVRARAASSTRSAGDDRQ